MQVLVTGGTGFVGRRVVSVLVAAGHSVRLACRARRGDAGVPAIEVGEISLETDWTRALQGVDAVVHLAARAHVMRDSAVGAEQFKQVNSAGTLSLARAAVEAGVRRFVFMSTIKVNGEFTTGRPFQADDPPNASDPYARSKLDAEEGLRALSRIETVIIRPPLVYGAGVKGNLARLCQLAKLGVPVPFGAIDNRRDLIGVSNLAGLVERCVWHPRAAGGVFLASDAQPVSTPHLYTLIASAHGRSPRMLRVPVELLRALATPLGFGSELDRLTQSLELDIRKSRDELDWQPTVSLEQGITEMVRSVAKAAT